MPNPVASAAIQALAAYGAPQRTPSTAGADPFAPQPRETVRRAGGVSVELTAEARATLIAVQSAASETALPAALRPQTPAGPIERPGSRVNLSI